MLRSLRFSWSQRRTRPPEAAFVSPPTSSERRASGNKQNVHSAISHQPAAISKAGKQAISLQPSAIRHAHSATAFSHQPSTIMRQPSAVNLQPSAIGRQPSAISLQPSVISQQPLVKQVNKHNQALSFLRHPILPLANLYSKVSKVK